MITFRPSDRLVKLTEKCLIPLEDEEVKDLLLDCMTGWFGPVDIAGNLRQILIDDISDMCSSLAKEAYQAGKRLLKLTENGFFTFQVCSELVKRIGINPAINIIPWGALLLEEFKNSLKERSHTACWGLVAVMDNEIVIMLEEYLAFWDPVEIAKRDAELFRELDSGFSAQE